MKIKMDYEKNFPKGTEFLKLTKEELNIAVQKINNRLRKYLNKNSPKRILGRSKHCI